MDIVDEEYEECWIYQVKGQDSISDDTDVKKCINSSDDMKDLAFYKQIWWRPIFTSIVKQR